MSSNYIALARKWRPRRFADLVGQEHVRRALTHALDTDRVHHAFLFTGTRGVGKTTIARILAKCLNCETGVSANPCGECASCREIDAGRFVDLIEVDAASRTKVDDTRELLENVQYAPTRGRYKVYLIDEVHMLSTHSFNALLKTLEEPPPRVKFLLATTDPQKLPVTVLSRCLQFNLKRLPVTLISDLMRRILEAEGIPFDAGGVRLVAQAADGSARDGLSLLDQLIAFGGGKVGEAEARAMLGTVARDHVVRLAELLGKTDPAEIMRFARSLEEWAPDYAQLLDELASLLARVALKQVVPDYDADELYAPELLEQLARQLAPEDVQLFYQTAIIGRRDLNLAPDPRTGFEMALLRMIAFRPTGDAAQLISTPPVGERGSPAHAAGARPLGAPSASAESATPQTSGVSGAAAARLAASGGISRGAEAARAAAAGRKPTDTLPRPEDGAARPASGGAQSAGSSSQASGSPVAREPESQARASQPYARVSDTAQNGSDTAARSAGEMAVHSASDTATRGGSDSAARGGNDMAARGGSDTANRGGNDMASRSGSHVPGVGSDPGTRAGPSSAPGPAQSATLPPSSQPQGAGAALSKAWLAIFNQLDLQGAARQLASHCVLIGQEGAVVRLAMHPRNQFVRTRSQEEKLAQALSRHFGANVKLEFEAAGPDMETPAQAEQRMSQEEIAAARETLDNDPTVRAFKERFNATLLPDTVRPTK